MIKILGEACLVEYLDRDDIAGLPEQRKVIIVEPDSVKTGPDLGFGLVRLVGEKSQFKVGQVLIFTAGRKGSRVEFNDMLATGQTLHLLKDGDVFGEFVEGD